jgi:hypothetical protein
MFHNKEQSDSQRSDNARNPMRGQKRNSDQQVYKNNIGIDKWNIALSWKFDSSIWDNDLIDWIGLLNALVDDALDTGRTVKAVKCG